MIENIGGFDHLNHEGRLTGVDFILGADAGENAVHQADARGSRPARKLPICAISTISATWRRKVLFPLMLGPVMMRMISPVSKIDIIRDKSFTSQSMRSTTGWRPSWISRMLFRD